MIYLKLIGAPNATIRVSETEVVSFTTPNEIKAATKRSASVTKAISNGILTEVIEASYDAYQEALQVTQISYSPFGLSINNGVTKAVFYPGRFRLSEDGNSVLIESTEPNFYIDPKTVKSLNGVDIAQTTSSSTILSAIQDLLVEEGDLLKALTISEPLTELDCKYKMFKLAVEVSGDITFSNLAVGVYIFNFTQVGDGAFAVGFPNTIKWPGGVPPTLTTGDSTKTDIVTIIYDGTNLVGNYSLNQATA